MALLQRRRWDNGNDVHMRLNGSVIKYRNRPVYVNAEGHDLTVDTFDLINKEKHRVDSADEELDISAQKLGYVNDGKGDIYYPYRMPARRQKQGLSTDNCGQVYVDPVTRTVMDKGGFLAKNQLTSNAFGYMMMNDYPDVHECVETLNKKQDWVGMAFGRKLALVRDDVGIIKLHYFNQPVGWKKKDNTFMVPDKHGHYIPLLKMFGVECKLSED